MKVALLMLYGFNDWNVMLEYSYCIYKVVKEKGLFVQIYYYQAGYGGLLFMWIMNCWFICYLYGVDNGVEDDFVVWIVREEDENSNFMFYEDYLNLVVEVVIFYLKGGVLGQGVL